MQTVVEVLMVTANELGLEIAIESVKEGVIEACMELTLKLSWETPLRLPWSAVGDCVYIVSMPRAICVSLRSAVVARFWPVSLASQFVKRSFHLTLRLFV